MIPAIGSTVIYGTNGICRVEDKRTESLGGVCKEYYILRSLSDKHGMTIFLPADNEQLLSTLQPILPPEELTRIARETPIFSEDAWPSDARARTKRTREILVSGDREQLISLVKTLHRDACRDTARGKRVTPSAETALARAEDMLYQEFSLVFEMKEEELFPFLSGKITLPVKQH